MLYSISQLICTRIQKLNWLDHSYKSSSGELKTMTWEWPNTISIFFFFLWTDWIILYTVFIHKLMYNMCILYAYGITAILNRRSSLWLATLQDLPAPLYNLFCSHSLPLWISTHTSFTLNPSFVHHLIDHGGLCEQALHQTAKKLFKF